MGRPLHPGYTYSKHVSIVALFAQSGTGIHEAGYLKLKFLESKNRSYWRTSSEKKRLPTTAPRRRRKDSNLKRTSTTLPNTFSPKHYYFGVNEKIRESLLKSETR